METMQERWRRGAVTDISQLCRGRPILVLAPHADDETIGCGGLIRQAAGSDLPVAIDILTDGSRSHPASKLFDRPRLAALRRDEARRAVACLGADPESIHFWPEEDSTLPGDGPKAAPLVARLRRRLEDTRAEAVFVTWVDDPHCDHEAAFALALQAIAGSATRLFGYPVWSWTVDRPRSRFEGPVSRLAIDAELAAKRAAIACHASQLGQVVPDDPAGFSLSAADLALFIQPFETFIEIVRPEPEGSPAPC